MGLKVHIHPDPAERAAALRDVVLAQAEHHERQAAELRGHASTLERMIARDAARWTTCEVAELVPGDHVNAGGTEVEVLHVGWCDVDKRTVLVAFPSEHGGTFDREYRWQAGEAVQVREQLHERLVAELSSSEPELAEVGF